MDVAIPLVVITVLILVNAVFVAAEFAIAGAPRVAIDRRAAEGQRLARAVRRVLRDPRRQDRYIATAQLGITFASLGLGMYGEHQLATWIYDWLPGEGSFDWLASHALATVLAVALLTYFHIVIGEMVPKAIALQNAEETSLWITPPMRWIQLAMYPLVLGLNGIGNLVLRLFQIRREAGMEQYYTPEEIRMIVRESMAEGELPSESATVLSELFDFAELTAGEVMVPRVNVVGIELGASAAEVANVLRASHFTRYPVYEEDLDHIAGMVHIKDLLEDIDRDQPLGRRTLRPVPFVPETSKLESLLNVLRTRRTQMAVVLDEFGGTAGIVTLDDLFEEVVGDLADETVEHPEIFVDGMGRLTVAGPVRLAEVGDHLGLSLEHEDVETVSGLVLMLLDRPPRVGDVVTWHEAMFRVTTVAGHGVRECTVTRLAAPADADDEDDD